MCFDFGLHPERYKNAPAAALNISMCDASAVGPCEIMEKRFEVPFIQETLPLGVRASSNYFRQICKKLKSEYNLDKDEKDAKKEIDKYRNFLKDKRQ